MSRRLIGGVVIAAATTVSLTVSLTLSACTNEPDDPPGLDRIDGPAQVDPSFDPFATTTPKGTGG